MPFLSIPADHNLTEILRQIYEFFMTSYSQSIFSCSGDQQFSLWMLFFYRVWKYSCTELTAFAPSATAVTI